MPAKLVDTTNHSRRHPQSILRPTNFNGAKLLDASFFGAELSVPTSLMPLLETPTQADVTKMNLTNANLEGTLVTWNTYFKGPNLYRADFTDVPL